jgi:CO/xanthine dehydrogenase FAD-binding subunit
MRPFAYERPTSLADAVALLTAGGARPLAGGTDLIIRLRDGTIRPDVVVDVKLIRELDSSIREDGDRLVIGALTVMTDIAAHPRIRREFTALAEAAAVVGAVQIRNRATLAGNICNASPAADTLPALLVFGADVVAAGSGGSRRLPLDDVLVRSGVTTLAPDELVTAIELPLPDGKPGSVHLRTTRRRGHDLASVTMACAAMTDGTLRLSFGSVGPRPLVVAIEDATPEALDRVFAAATPSPRSMRASPEYRLAMLRVLGRRAIDEATRRRRAA